MPNWVKGYSGKRRTTRNLVRMAAGFPPLPDDQGGNEQVIVDESSDVPEYVYNETEAAIAQRKVTPNIFEGLRALVGEASKLKDFTFKVDMSDTSKFYGSSGAGLPKQLGGPVAVTYDPLPVATMESSNISVLEWHYLANRTWVIAETVREADELLSTIPVSLLAERVENIANRLVTPLKVDAEIKRTVSIFGHRIRHNALYDWERQAIRALNPDEEENLRSTAPSIQDFFANISGKVPDGAAKPSNIRQCVAPTFETLSNADTTELLGALVRVYDALPVQARVALNDAAEKEDELPTNLLGTMLMAVLDSLGGVHGG